jgi:hypothetical protein
MNMLHSDIGSRSVGFALLAQAGSAQNKRTGNKSAREQFPNR